MKVMTDKEQRKRKLYIQNIKEATSDGKFKPEEPKKEVVEKIYNTNARRLFPRSWQQ